jgi:GNAT superfamily N-acetyltransferase
MTAIRQSSEFLRKLQNIFLGIPTNQFLSPSRLTVSYKTDNASIRRFHREIIGKCFPVDERGSAKGILADVKAGNCAVFLVEEGRKILGGVVVNHYWSTGKKIMLLTWLAVQESQRGRNVGTLLVEEAVAYAKANEAALLLGQIEDPSMFEEEISAYGNPKKRVQFYTRFGCKRLEVPCYVPAFEVHQEPVRGIMLTMFPLSQEQEIATEISLPELPVFVEELLGYETDPESLSFVEACKGTVALTPFGELFKEDNK